MAKRRASSSVVVVVVAAAKEEATAGNVDQLGRSGESDGWMAETRSSLS